jgi:hypothetical protein
MVPLSSDPFQTILYQRRHSFLLIYFSVAEFTQRLRPSDFAFVLTHTVSVSLHHIRVVTSSIDDPGNQRTLSPLQRGKKKTKFVLRLNIALQSAMSAPLIRHGRSVMKFPALIGSECSRTKRWHGRGLKEIEHKVYQDFDWLSLGLLRPKSFFFSAACVM